MEYKDLYLEMMRASEKAIRLLAEAQQKCEDRYLSSSEKEHPLPELKNTPQE